MGYYNGKVLTERRDSIRLSKELPVSFSFPDTEGSESAKSFLAKTCDIGVGGVCFETPVREREVAKRLLSRQKDVELDIDLVETRKRIKTRAKIAWAFGILDTNILPIRTRYRLGLSFTGLDDAEKKMISSYIEEVLFKRGSF